MSDDPHPPVGPAPSSPPAGWYPDPMGTVRWWDGTAWGQAAPVAPSVPVAQPYGAPPVSSWQDERTLAVLAPVLMLFFGFIGPLVIYLVAKPEQAYARHHAAEALNFSITLFIAALVSLLLVLVIIGIPLLLVVIVLGIVFPIIAAIAANRGEWYRYPINIRIVPGAVG